jgi:hypothetical protein
VLLQWAIVVHQGKHIATFFVFGGAGAGNHGLLLARQVCVLSLSPLPNPETHTFTSALSHTDYLYVNLVEIHVADYIIFNS